MSKHTPEPWIYHSDTGVIQYVGSCDMSDADAERIVACVNACAGIPTDDIAVLVGCAINDIRKQNAELSAQYADRVATSEKMMQALEDASVHMSEQAAVIAELSARVAELVAAAKQYAENWLTDERDDHDREICISDEHYNDVQALFKAIAKAGKP